MLATLNVPEVPLSTKLNKVFGVPSASLIYKVPLVPAWERVITGAALDNVKAEALVVEIFPVAAMVVALAIAPVLAVGCFWKVHPVCRTTSLRTTLAVGYISIMIALLYSSTTMFMGILPRITVG